jgi:hypothetical protein
MATARATPREAGVAESVGTTEKEATMTDKFRIADDECEEMALELLLLRTSNDTRGKELVIAALEGWLCDGLQEPVDLYMLLEDVLHKRRLELEIEENWIASGAPRITKDPDWAWRPDKQGR